jgi:uncharacterized delta-60 repeat protein
MTHTRWYWLRRVVLTFVLCVRPVSGVAASPPGLGFDPGTDGLAYAVVVQPDGKILIGGNFRTMGRGATGPKARSRIARLNPDGSVDESFDPGADSTVNAMALLPDGKILVGGIFQRIGGGGTGRVSRRGLARLNPDGSVDPGFTVGVSSTVLAIAVQSDGKILIGGLFFHLEHRGSTIRRSNIARINADGSIDAAFDPGANFSVHSLNVEPDGRILAGGVFTRLGGGGTGTTARQGIGRLHANGTLDTSFKSVVTAGGPYVRAVARQADGRILVGGAFSIAGSPSEPPYNLVRLNADGSLDPTFASGAFGGINALIVQADGKILVAGYFSALGSGANSIEANAIARLNADGSADAGFSQVFAHKVWIYIEVMALQPDGRILLGGTFDTLGYGAGTRPRRGIGRLNADGSVDGDLVSGFTDAPLIAGVTSIRAIHLTELRTRIDLMRERFGLGVFVWTDTSVEGAPTRAAHLLEMRSALGAAYVAAGLAPPSFTDATLDPRQMLIRVVHIEELRTGVVALAYHPR